MLIWYGEGKGDLRKCHTQTKITQDDVTDIPPWQLFIMAQNKKDKVVDVGNDQSLHVVVYAVHSLSL